MAAVWLGLAEVSIGPGCVLDLDGAGAFVWWATQADCKETFVRKVDATLKDYGLVPVGYENIEAVLNPMDLIEELFEIATRAEESPDYVLYGTFHVFDHHNA